jgi:uncharacterized membrane protein
MGQHSLEEREEQQQQEARGLVRDRFGGFDFPATLAGLFSGIGVLVVLGGIFAAAGNFGYLQTENITAVDEVTEEVALGGVIAGLVTLFVAFLVGGWVAGRVSRYDGNLNGLIAGAWFVLLAAIFGALGAWAETEWDVFAEVDLPAWFSFEDYTVATVATAALGIALVLVAGWLGGLLGERYHRKADAEVIRGRSSGVRHDSGRHDTVVSGHGDAEVTDARRVEERRR